MMDENTKRLDIDGSFALLTQMKKNCLDKNDLQYISAQQIEMLLDIVKTAKEKEEQFDLYREKEDLK